MIRINLLPTATPAQRWGGWAVMAVPADQRPALLGVGVLLATALTLAGAWWSLDHTRRQLDADIAVREAELVRLQALVRLVELADTRARQVDERLTLIARLRATQRAPVTLLDAIADTLPDGLWLLEVKQQAMSVRVEGRALSLTALTDFVDRLQTSGRFARPIDIVTTSMEALGDASVVRFAIRGDVQGVQ